MPKQPLPKGTPVSYDKAKLFDTFLAYANILCRHWDALYNLYLIPGRLKFWESFTPYLTDCINTAITASVYLDIAKLNDRVISQNHHGKANLVLRRVIEDLAPSVGTPERNAVEAEYARLLPTVEKLKEWRDKFGAHSDLLRALATLEHLTTGTPPSNPIPFISLRELSEAVDCITRITDAIVLHRQPDLVGKWNRPLIPEDVDKLMAKVRAGTPPGDIKQWMLPFFRLVPDPLA